MKGLKGMVQLVAFSGYARSGKDTAAAVLVEEGGWERLAFADVLRDCLEALDPQVKSQTFGDYRHMALSTVLYEWGWDKYKESPYSDDIRRLLQRLGTEVGRNILGENIWVDATLAKMEPGKRYVITDCRFPNEAQAVVKNNGQVFRIKRKGYGPINNHPSETSLDDWNFLGLINNDTTLEEFKDKVRRTFL